MNGFNGKNLKIIAAVLITGIGAGLIASLLKWLLELIGRLALGVGATEGPDPWILAFPITGLILTNLYRHYISHRNVAHGTERLHNLVAPGAKPYIAPGIAVDSIIGCVFTIGFGGSAGSEGPCAYSSAAVGNGIARRFGLDDKWLRLMIGIGAGAGIAGIFKAPTGGMLYTLEVLRMEITTIPVLALIVACILATVMANVCSGYMFDIRFDMSTPFEPGTLVWVAILGVFCGFYTIWYLWTMRLFDGFLGKMNKVWKRILAAGCITSLAVFLIPTLFGEGERPMTAVINGGQLPVFIRSIFSAEASKPWMLIALTGGILIIKGVLVSGANCVGVAGKFVPAMFTGAVAGYFFGLSMDAIFGIELHIWYLALAGMGAILGSATNAPIMALFILCETTDTFQYMPAYIVCIGISFTITCLAKRWIALEPPPIEVSETK